MEQRSKFFEAFLKQEKKEKTRIRSKKKEFYFLFDRDENGYFVKTVNNSLKSVKLDSEKIKRENQKVLDLYNKIKFETKKIVEWSNPKSRVFLHRHNDLLTELYYCDNLIDRYGKKIYNGSDINSVEVTIIPENETFICRLTVSNREVDSFISDRFAIAGNTILMTNNIGGSFSSIMELDTTITVSELNLYLSILFSNFENINILYRGYRVINGGECDIEPALVIDSIDDSGFLSLNLSYCYKDILRPEFFYKYKPTFVTDIDDIQCSIIYHRLIKPDFDPMDKLISILFTLEKKYEFSDKFNIDDDGVTIHPDLSLLLFGSEFKAITDVFTLFGEEFLQKNKIKKCNPNLELKLQSAIDFLQGSADLLIYGEALPLYKAVEHFETKGYIPLNDGSKGIVNKKFIEKIKKVIRRGKNGVEVSFFDLPYIENELESKLKDDSFRRSIDLYKNIKKSEDINLRLGNFNGVLRDYQQKGVYWLLNLYKIGISGCLSDDMGLGKTIQTLAFLTQIIEDSNKEPVLIVVPKSLIFNWIKELNKFTPNLTYSVYYGKDRNTDIFNSSNIVFTTYHTLRNDIEDLKEINFFYTILDEIHTIKNHTSGLAKAAFLIKSRYRLGISGTPIENSLSDLYSISRFLNPSMFGSFRKFKEEWFGPVYSEESEIITNILRNKISPIFLRRLKSEVLLELPDKTEQVIYVDMNEKQKSLYEQKRKMYHDAIRLKIKDSGVDKNRLFIIKAFMELRQIATIPEVKSSNLIDSPKIEILLEQILETISEGNKVVIFSNFLASIKKVSQVLEESNILHKVITGSTNNRNKCITDFTDLPDVKAMVMTLKTGGVGLNLTAASYVYILDPWWNLSSENQAIDRTHRIGQKDPVFCYRLIARGSIEEKILELQNKKKLLFENLFNKNDMNKQSISNQDIEYLLE